MQEGLRNISINEEEGELVLHYKGEKMQYSKIAKLFVLCKEIEDNILAN
ncbi:MAG: hypothetical protein HFJ48_05335 [Clostridia bacterium]|nr:hypothetical protein [Clostridia bacterium]